MLTIAFGKKVRTSIVIEFYRPSPQDFLPYIIRPAYLMGEKGFRMVGAFGIQVTISRIFMEECMYRATDGSAIYFKEMSEPYDAYEIGSKRFERNPF